MTGWQRKRKDDPRGLRCSAHGYFSWPQLNWFIRGASDDLEFVFSCPVCFTELRIDPFHVPV